ncbi:hypothetical protein BACT_0881 [Bifidobacterium actinocoloniiforme DSM 22766]|uniref:Uncharacterized protein n=1 Tax=Bifidobacterium actinocoloniiforme DSM 22766 TaxID=1437605 RepID=A0A086Z0X9_9BIFI|nr:hypothetical protein BACT_0881 [Bifidobacterium actinocoloniiforme DSM 22766]
MSCKDSASVVRSQATPTTISDEAIFHNKDWAASPTATRRRDTSRISPVPTTTACTRNFSCDRCRSSRAESPSRLTVNSIIPWSLAWANMRDTVNGVALL